MTTPTNNSPQPIRTHGFIPFLGAGFVGAFLTALIFLVVLQLTLPPADEAYGQSVFSTLADPIVIAIATPVALAAGALATPLLYFCLRDRRLSISLPIVFGSVLVAVIVTTPLSPLLGLFSSIAALIISCIVCTRIRATSLEVSHDAVGLSHSS